MLLLHAWGESRRCFDRLLPGLTGFRVYAPDLRGQGGADKPEDGYSLAFEDDPNLTDRKFPGNPTRSYRTREPLRVLGEVPEWQPHSPEALQHMLSHLEELKRQGIEAID